MLRKNQSDRLHARESSEAHGAHGDSDQTHAHFVNVLEQIYSILQPHMLPPLAASTEKSNDSSTDTEDPFSNLFSNLDLEEPSQAFLDAPDIDATSASEVKAVPKYEVEPSQSIEEYYLAAHLLFEDIRRIRSFTKQVWREYLNGLDLSAASVTINTAIVMVRELEQEFHLQFPGRKGYEGVTSHIFIAQALHRGQSPDIKERPSDLFNFALYDLVEEVMMGTYSTISSLQDTLEPGIVPVYRPGHFGSRDYSIPWLAKSPRQQFKDDQLVLFEIWPDLVLMARITEKTTISEDELLRGIRGMKPSSDIPLWLVFAFQCFLDAQHILGQDLERPFNQLKQTSGSIGRSIRLTLEFHKSLRVETWPKTNDGKLQEMLVVIKDWVDADVIVEKLERVCRYSLVLYFTDRIE